MIRGAGFALGFVAGIVAGGVAALALVPSSLDERRDRIRALADAKSSPST